MVMLGPKSVFQKAPRAIIVGCVRSKTTYKNGTSQKHEGVIRWNKDTYKLYGRILNSQRITGNKGSQITDGTKEELACDLTNKDLYEKYSSRIITKDELNKIKEEILPSDIANIKPKNISKSVVQSPQSIAKMKPLMSSGVLASKSSPFLSIITRNLRSFPLLCNQKVTVESKSDVVNDKKLVQITAAMQGEARTYPAVTSILNETLSEQAKSALDKWKQEKIAELGLKGFEVFQKGLLENGIKFHNAIQQFLLESKEPSVEKQIEGVWTSVNEVVKMINRVRSIESHVSHPILKYRGIIDCIAHYEDKPTLIEWKKSDKPKHSLTSTFDNPVQLAAYFGAISHDPHYKHLKVRDALLVIAYTDGSKADYFHLNAEEMRKHWGAWLTRYENYLEIKAADVDDEDRSLGVV